MCSLVTVHIIQGPPLALVVVLHQGQLISAVPTYACIPMN
jgi:hypothetical protein